jgi:hypothetical protein
MALVTFPERKVTRAAGRRGKDMDVVLQRAKAAHFVRDTMELFAKDGTSKHLLPQAGEGIRWKSFAA